MNGAMDMFELAFHGTAPLVVQIVSNVKSLIDAGQLRAGAKLPSIRRFAQLNGISVFTVVEAYNRLVAMGYVVSRLNAGFFVSARSVTLPTPVHIAVTPPALENFDEHWYARRIFENDQLTCKPGCGWLPESWLFEAGVRRAMRQISARDPIALGGYGEPLGYLPLRQLIGENASPIGIPIRPEQVLLTHGATQAIDILIRRLVTPGDIILVDDPGDPGIHNMLRLAGAKLQGMPRTPQGWDLEAVSALVQRLRPKLCITQPRLHNPTGSVASLQQLHALLRLAEQHDVLLVEIDTFGELDAEARPTLASLDQLARVAYVGSFSHSVAPSLRCGYLIANQDLMQDLVLIKMMAGLTSSDMVERIVHAALSDSHRPRFMRSLRLRLGQAHSHCAQQLKEMGFTLFNEPAAGMFLWVRHARIADPLAFAAQAIAKGVMLGPGCYFSSTKQTQPYPWMRFNVAQCEDEEASSSLYAWLQEAVAAGAPDGA